MCNWKIKINLMNVERKSITVLSLIILVKQQVILVKNNLDTQKQFQISDFARFQLQHFSLCIHNFSILSNETRRSNETEKNLKKSLAYYPIENQLYGVLLD